jgi:peroxiredoxin
LRNWFRFSVFVLLGVLLTFPSLVEAYQGAPDFTLPVVGANGLTGQHLTFSSFRGRAVLLEFMVPSSSHCQNMVPILESMYQQYQSQIVVFLSVSGAWGGATASDAAAFIRTYHTTWTYVYDPSGSVSNAYGVTAIPVFFAIGTGGSIVETYTGEEPQATLTNALTEAMATAIEPNAATATQSNPIFTNQIPVSTFSQIYWTYVEYLLVVAVADVVLAALVWRDASRLGEKNAALWALGTFLVLIVVLPVYLIFRSKGMIGKPRETREQQIVTAGEPRLESGVPSTMFCPACGNKIPRESKFCKECGAKLE